MPPNSCEPPSKQKQLSESAGENLTRWLTEPQYQAYRDRLEEMLQTGQFEMLDLLFWEVIPFGTGGRRGMMSEFGSATINERTIAESADGMARYLQKTRGGNAGGTAVIAHDTRNRSREFAELTACIFAARGLKVYLFDAYRSTPELSFAVRYFGCDIGVMISASHNPPADNGFKAYWSHGGQVLPPHDEGIIACVYDSGEIPRANLDEAQEGRANRDRRRNGGQSVFGGDLGPKFVRRAEHRADCLRRCMAWGELRCFPVLQRAGFSGIAMFEPQSTARRQFPQRARSSAQPGTPGSVRFRD